MLIELVSGQFVIVGFLCSVVKWERNSAGVCRVLERWWIFGGSTFRESHLHGQVDLMEKSCWGLKPSCLSPETADVSLALCSFSPLFSSYMKNTASP